MMNSSFKIINSVIFQIGWFICILTNNTISLGFTLLFVACNFLGIYFLTKTLLLKVEISWLLICITLGTLCEMVFFNSGILHQADSNTLAITRGLQLPPTWLVCLWAMFAILMRTSLTFIFSKPFTTCGLALIVAPCNYYAGASLNPQVDIGSPLLLNLSGLGIAWALVMGCLIAIHNRFFKDKTTHD